MSHLNKLVRRVLLEADAKSQTAQVEPQKAASASQPKIKAAARAVKGRENAIAPASYVDPSAYVVGTTVGFGNSTMADVKAQRAQKASASVIDRMTLQSPAPGGAAQIRPSPIKVTMTLQENTQKRGTRESA